MAQYPKLEILGSIGSIILGILEVQVGLLGNKCRSPADSFVALRIAELLLVGPACRAQES